MSTVYEYVRDGQVVDRVQPADAAADAEATRLGVAALDAQEAAARGETLTEYWRVEGQDPFASASETNEPPSPVEPAGEPDDTEPAQPANPKE